LTVSDGQRLIGVGERHDVRRDESLAGHFAHRGQHARIANAARFDLIVNHRSAGLGRLDSPGPWPVTAGGRGSTGRTTGRTCQHHDQ
jgi:hypothetical protein